MKKRDIVIRKCIFCDADDSKTLFVYTYDFLKNIRNNTSENLAAIGWAQDITSSIVKCNVCGCNYIRDVFTSFEMNKPELSEAEILKRGNKSFSYKKLGSLCEKMWAIQNVLNLTINEFNKDINFLDYGAGSGGSCSMAKALGVKNVYAFEPYNYNPYYYKMFNFPGIIASRSIDEISKHRPYHAIVCTGVIEHLLNPREEVKNIYDLMASGAYAYFSAPFLDLDRQLNLLLNAKSIKKEMLISHYHPGHMNYLTPKRFVRILEDTGFQLINFANNSPTLLQKERNMFAFVRRSAVCLTKRIFNCLGIPYPRTTFIVRKR